MLVLSRHLSERIFIDNGRIKITIVEIRGDKVRIGIDAPPEVTIDREEVHSAKQKEHEDDSSRTDGSVQEEERTDSATGDGGG